MKEQIGIIGLGFVGGAVKNAFEKHFTLLTYDLIEEKSNVGSVQEMAEKCSVIFMALPTPINDDGSLNSTAIENTLDMLNQANKFNIVVLKSSIPPGTTQKFQQQYPNLQLIFNPEFLTERNAIQDFKNQKFVILGGDPLYTRIAKILYKKVLPQVEIHETDTNTAEMVKFSVNCFLAAKITFFNEIYQICQKLQIDYDKMKDLTILDQRIGSSHTNVPGWDGHMGFGGSCFIPNCQILLHKMKELEINPTFLQGVWDKNMEMRPEKDWEKLEGRAVIKGYKK